MQAVLRLLASGPRGPRCAAYAQPDWAAQIAIERLCDKQLTIVVRRAAALQPTTSENQDFLDGSKYLATQAGNS